MINSILLVEYEHKDILLYSKLSQLNKYSITRVNNYTSFLNYYKYNKYDLCLINLLDKQERDFILYFLTQSKINQKVLFLNETLEDCFFERNCSLCKDFNAKPMINSITQSDLDSCIESFNMYCCKFYKSHLLLGE